MTDRFKFRTPYYYRYGDPEQNIKSNGFAYFSYFNLTDCPTERTTNGIPCYRNKGEYEQCTGLKDKNGNLIYEGDIIRFCLNTRGYVLAYERAVVWDNESASFMIVSNLDQVKPRTKRQMPNIKTHNIEIIGNIHEQAEQKDIK